jgi:hypothetical protein
MCPRKDFTRSKSWSLKSGLPNGSGGARYGMASCPSFKWGGKCSSIVMISRISFKNIKTPIKERPNAMKKEYLKQIEKDILSKKISLEQVEQDINDGKYSWEDIDKMSYNVQMLLSRNLADIKLEKVLPQFENEPRDWKKIVKNRYICGIKGETIYDIPFLMIHTKEDAVVIHSSREGGEVFRTKEKLDSFIEHLTEARDSVFPD